MNRYYLKTGLKRSLAICMMVCSTIGIRAQVMMKLADLSGFQSPSSNWHIAGNVSADLSTANKLFMTSGTGILVNQPEQGVHFNE